MAKLTLKKPLSLAVQAKFAQMPEVSILSQPDSKIQEMAQERVLIEQEQREKSLEKLKAGISWLEETFPTLFNFTQPKPLKRGVDRELRVLIPKPLSKSQVRKALRAYVQREAYWKAILKENWRYGLDGEKVEKILEAHKEHAQKKLSNMLQ